MMHKFVLCILMMTSFPLFAGTIYKIDTEHTFSSFEYKHWGLSLQRGRFDKSTGFIDFNPSEKTGQILLEIETNSVSTGIDSFNSILRSDGFFDSQQYPKIIFKSSKFIFEEEKLIKIEGMLTIKDVTKSVVVDVVQFNCRFMMLYLKEACGANGQAKILRSDFNVGRFVPFVSDEITLFFTVEAIKE